MTNSSLTRRKALALSAACVAGSAFSQYFVRPLSVVVPQPAGNPTDGIARKLQPILQKELG